jgi:hypothetical protein
MDKSSRRIKCFKELGNIEREMSLEYEEYMSLYVRNMNAYKEWNQYLKLKEEYAKTYIKCMDDIRPSK